jgi:hypothetical protein
VGFGLLDEEHRIVAVRVDDGVGSAPRTAEDLPTVGVVMTAERRSCASHSLVTILQQQR